MTEPPVPSARRAFAQVGQRLPSRHRLSREAVEASQRARVQYALLEVAAEKGYNSVTIGDVVERAGVSRQAFYQCFENKEACFVAAFDIGSEIAVSTVGTSLETVPYTDWREGAKRTMRAYLEVLASEPKASWALHIEALAAGPAVVKRHTEVAHQIASLLRWTYDGVVRKQYPERSKLPAEMFDLLVEGFAGRIRHCLRTEGAAALPALEPLLVNAILVMFGENIE